MIYARNILALAFLVLSMAVLVFVYQYNTATGSVFVGNEYLSTTTATMSGGVSIAPNKQITIGSIVVASSSVGTLEVRDATSTTDTASTTFTVLKASIGEGTYTYDVRLKRGLAVELGSGFDGDYVITFRP